MLSVQQVAARMNMSASWVWAALKSGEFPEPRRLSTRCTRWDSAAIDRYIEEQFAGADRG